jgi:CDP-glucose 4,6-dehydratase
MQHTHENTEYSFTGKKILITGHTGFKGMWLAMFLKQLGAILHGVALPPTKHHPIPALFDDKNYFFKTNKYADIRDVFLFDCLLEEIRPDFIFHLASQPLVLPSYIDPNDTFTTNIVGCINLFDSIRRFSKKHPDHKLVVLNVTTDKVYRNIEDELHPADVKNFKGYSEEDALGGDDPYSASKSCADIVANSYAKSFFKESNICLVNARYGNVIGGGDFSKNRLIPEIIRAIQDDTTLTIKNPNAIRPWQHVLDVIRGYLILAMQSYKDYQVPNTDKTSYWNGHSFNFGPKSDDILQSNWNVAQVLALFTQQLESARNLDVYFNESPGNKETNLLLLKSDKAKKILQWDNTISIIDSIRITAEWYDAYLSKSNMLDFTQKQIQDFLNKNPIKPKTIF